MTTIRITLELTASGRWRVMLGAKLLVTSKDEPVASAARVLLAEGLPDNTVLEASYKGTDEPMHRATLWEAAGWRLPGREGTARRDSVAGRYSEAPEP